MRALILFLLSLAAAPADARGGSVIAAGGQWAALLRDGRCDAQSRVVTRVGKAKVSGVAGFAFALDRRPWGQFHARLSREPRAGASVLASVGGRQFLLAARGRFAWSRSAAQDRELMAAVRGASRLRVQSRDRAGRRFSDDYGLAFAATAIDAAAARCAALATGQ
jgi:hypothetical protein